MSATSVSRAGKTKASGIRHHCLRLADAGCGEQASRRKVAEQPRPLKEIPTRLEPPRWLAWHPRFRLKEPFDVPHAEFWCETDDGVRLAGSLLGRTEGSEAVVLAHGFMAYRTKPRFRMLAEALAERFAVFAFDLRGHGGSQGWCTGGDREALDVHAIVQAARNRGFERVMTVGASLGGIAVIREAAEYADVDAVVAISTPARWGGESKPVQRLTWLFATAAGRALAKSLGGVRLAAGWDHPSPPIDVVGRIAPTPLLLIHGDNDHFFPPSEARTLYDAAGEPKELVVLPGFGHAEDGFTPEFAERLGKELEAILVRSERSARPDILTPSQYDA